MQTTQQLLYKFWSLSTDSQENLLEYLNTLWQQEKEKQKPKKRGGLGTWQGKIKLSDDFNAPLEDFKDYM